MQATGVERHLCCEWCKSINCFKFTVVWGYHHFSCHIDAALCFHISLPPPHWWCETDADFIFSVTETNKCSESLSESSSSDVFHGAVLSSDSSFVSLMFFLSRAAQKLSLSRRKKSQPGPPSSPGEAPGALVYTGGFSGALQLSPPAVPPCLLRAGSKVKDTPGMGKVWCHVVQNPDQLVLRLLESHEFSLSDGAVGCGGSVGGEGSQGRLDEGASCADKWFFVFKGSWSECDRNSRRNS